MTTFTSVYAGAAEINGDLRTVGDQRVLQLWGTHYERGYAHGFLLADDILANMKIYAFPPPGESPIFYEMARTFILNRFTIAPEMLEEAEGMAAGMIDAGIGPYIDEIQRNLDANDIIMVNGLTELSEILCAALTAWGTATQADAELGGDLAIAHNTDYIEEPDDPYIGGRTGFVVAQMPIADDEYGFAAVTYPGILGVIAGMNDAGVGVVLNKGNYDLTAQPDSETEWPIGVWSARQALTTPDFDGDGEDSIADLIAFYDVTPVHSPSIIQFFGTADNNDPPAAVLEANYEQRAMRWPDDANLPADVMLTLNWEDALVPTRSDRAQLRYIHSLWLINDVYGGDLDLSEMWDYVWEARGGYGISVTLHSMIFIPDQMKLGTVFWDGPESNPSSEHQWYDYADLFLEIPDDDADDDADDDTTDDDEDDDTGDDDADDDSSGTDDDASPGDDDGGGDDDGCGC